MKTSEVFRRVRLHLSNAWTPELPAHKRYICMALHELYLRGAIGDRDRTKGRRLIRAHLGGKYSLEHWLWCKHDISVGYNKLDVRKSIVTRKAWLTHLIEHYESKGD